MTLPSIPTMIAAIIITLPIALFIEGFLFWNEGDD